MTPERFLWLQNTYGIFENTYIVLVHNSKMQVITNKLKSNLGPAYSFLPKEEKHSNVFFVIYEKNICLQEGKQSRKEINNIQSILLRNKRVLSTQCAYSRMTYCTA